MIVLQNAWKSMIPLPLSSLLSPPTKRSLWCQGGVYFWQTSTAGKVAGDPCLFSYWSVGLHARPADEFFCNNLYSAGVWLAFGPPSSILCDCARDAEVLYCSSLKVHPNSDFHPLQIFITDQTQSLLKGIKKKSGIRQMFWNNGE